MWPTNRKSLYEAKNDSVENLEKLTKRFSNDLRLQIKRIGNHSLFTKDWLLLCGTLEHIAKIASIETAPKNKAPTTPPKGDLKSSSQSRKGMEQKKFGVSSPSFSSGGTRRYQQRALPSSPFSPSKKNDSKTSQQTLWEKEEYCVRYLVEEGKVNVLLRQLMDYKEKSRRIMTGKDSLSKYANRLKIDEKILRSKMFKFESSLGQLLKCCFQSIEALQTMDMPQLLLYISQILAFCNQNPQYFIREDDGSDTDEFGDDDPDDDLKVPNQQQLIQLQECVVFDYLRMIFKEIENLQEAEICQKVVEYDLFPKMLKFLHSYHQAIPNNTQFSASSALSRLLETEFSKTYRETLFKTDDIKKDLVALKKMFLKDLLTSYQRKKELRALSDNVMRYEIEFEGGESKDEASNTTAEDDGKSDYLKQLLNRNKTSNFMMQYR